MIDPKNYLCSSFYSSGTKPPKATKKVYYLHTLHHTTHYCELSHPALSTPAVE